ncbi:prepilin-type N-terminal cleavage/methylation domain-containing protein [Massilia eburnea]|nr:prepilin-type N-terminal cleavage/methylation domain-containing protein [Massilia eburnea]
MSNKSQRGFTLVEMIIAMVIIAVGLAGVLGVLSRTAVSSTDPMVSKQMTAIAEGMMEEIQLKPFIDHTATPFNGCDRSAFDDLDDYAGYGGANGIQVCTIDGTPGPAGYTVQVSMANAAGGILSGGIPAGETRQITVTVRKGNSSYQLAGWRTRFGG